MLLGGKPASGAVGEDDDVFEVTRGTRSLPPLVNDGIRSRSDGNTCRTRHLPARATCRRTDRLHDVEILAWTGPVFLFAVFVLWGIVARNMPPFPPSATPDQVKAHFPDLRLPLLIAMSVASR